MWICFHFIIHLFSAYPDVEIRTVTPEWEFIVLACDGIWDVMSNSEVVNYVRENIAAGVEPEEICESLMMRCLAPDCGMAGLGCDNMTVVIVALLHGGTYEQLSTKCLVPPPQNSDVENDDNSAKSEAKDEKDEEDPQLLPDGDL